MLEYMLEIQICNMTVIDDQLSRYWKVQLGQVEGDACVLRLFEPSYCLGWLLATAVPPDLRSGLARDVWTFA